MRSLAKDFEPWLAKISPSLDAAKFNAADQQERAHWDEYQSAYEDMIKNTSSVYAPWHIVPANNQWVSRAIVGRLVSETLESLELSYPVLNELQKEELQKAKINLENE